MTTKMNTTKAAIFMIAVLFHFGTTACEEKTSFPEEVEEKTHDNDTITENEPETLPIYEDLESLPPDLGLANGGDIDTVYRNQIAGIGGFGYMIYKPTAYDTHSGNYPLWIHLHGVGKRGDSETTPTDLYKVMWLGPLNLIKKKVWKPRYPFLVVGPQTTTNWDSQKLNTFISHIVTTYRVNPSRIYISGNSLGGGGTWSYVSKYGEASQCAAIVPICGNGTFNAAKFTNMPVWAFHGADDTTVPTQNSINHVNEIKALGSQLNYLPKLTIYPNVKHDSWTMTFDETGMGQESVQYDPYNISLTEWFLQYKKTE